MDQETSQLPSGYESVRRENLTYTLTREEIPWLAENEHELSLVKIALKGGGEFLFGSAIRNRRLLRAAEQLDKKRKTSADHILHTHLPDFIRQDHSNAIKSVDNRVSKKPVYYAGNPSGQRVYFMRFDEVNSLPVIIRIAVCDKSEQTEVLRVLTTSTYKQLKYTGKL